MDDQRQPVMQFGQAGLAGVAAIQVDAMAVTSRGLCRVADLREGDLLLSRDCGFIPVLLALPLAGKAPGMAVGPDTLGPGMPMGWITVSESTRLWNLRGAEGAHLASANDLRHQPNVHPKQAIALSAVLCERSTAILIDGAWVECPAPNAPLVATLLPLLSEENRTRLVAAFAHRPLPGRQPSDLPSIADLPEPFVARMRTGLMH